MSNLQYKKEQLLGCFQKQSIESMQVGVYLIELQQEFSDIIKYECILPENLTDNQPYDANQALISHQTQKNYQQQQQSKFQRNQKVKIISPFSSSKNIQSLKLEERVWFYIDENNIIQGPFTTLEMDNWFNKGYLSFYLKISFMSKDIESFFNLEDIFKSKNQYQKSNQDKETKDFLRVTKQDTKERRKSAENKEQQQSQQKGYAYKVKHICNNANEQADSSQGAFTTTNYYQPIQQQHQSPQQSQLKTITSSYNTTTTTNQTTQPNQQQSENNPQRSNIQQSLQQQQNQLQQQQQQIETLVDSQQQQKNISPKQNKAKPQLTLIVEKGEQEQQQQQKHQQQQIQVQKARKESIKRDNSPDDLMLENCEIYQQKEEKSIIHDSSLTIKQESKNKNAIKKEVEQPPQNNLEDNQQNQTNSSIIDLKIQQKIQNLIQMNNNQQQPPVQEQINQEQSNQNINTTITTTSSQQNTVDNNNIKNNGDELQQNDVKQQFSIKDQKHHNTNAYKYNKNQSNDRYWNKKYHNRNQSQGEDAQLDYEQDMDNKFYDDLDTDQQQNYSNKYNKSYKGKQQHKSYQKKSYNGQKFQGKNSYYYKQVVYEKKNDTQGRSNDNQDTQKILNKSDNIIDTNANQNSSSKDNTTKSNDSQKFTQRASKNRNDWN